MTPDELQILQEQIRALNAGIQMVAQMIESVESKIDQGQERQGERDETLVLIANQLVRLGEALPRIGDELAELATLSHLLNFSSPLVRVEASITGLVAYSVVNGS